MDDPEKPRPDVATSPLTENTLSDVRTFVGGDSGYCRQAGQLPGFGAQWGAHEKNKNGWAAVPAKVTSSFPSSARLEAPLAPLL